MKQFSRRITNLPILSTFNWDAFSARDFRYTPLTSPTNSPRRQWRLSSLSTRAKFNLLIAIAILVLISLPVLKSFAPGQDKEELDFRKQIPIGQSRVRNGREVFWWEQFPELIGYFNGRKSVVPIEEYVSEQDASPEENEQPLDGVTPGLQDVPSAYKEHDYECFVDEEKQLLPPIIKAYNGLPQHFPAPLFGDAHGIGISSNLCYDRINRYAAYGLGVSPANGGLGMSMHGDDEGIDLFNSLDWTSVRWNDAQKKCLEKRKKSTGTDSRNAFIIRTWNTFEYTTYHVAMLRAIISELSLASGGEMEVHFLIHVQNDSIPIWASEEVYNETLKASLPPEFEGMGTLWSVGQMKLIYPPPFPTSIINFSGGNVYDAYRSLHFPLQYFASRHPEFDYFWHWEMDMRVTGHYHELLSNIVKWADRQPQSNLWELSSKFFVPAMHDNSYKNFAISVMDEMAQEEQTAVSGPQLPDAQLLPVPVQQHATFEDGRIAADFITLNPLFDPSHTRWAFHDDITGYRQSPRPPTRASLITSSRLSRRLLLLMHEETFRNKHTMFPEMYPASIALHYGLKAVYAPLPVYFNRHWPAKHADEIFNNAKLGEASKLAGMDHGGGHFHGKGGSVFGPGEHVFRGATYYSNADFAQALWQKWLGNDKYIAQEVADGATGRMCLPMMVLHPVKDDG